MREQIFFERALRVEAIQRSSKYSSVRFSIRSVSRNWRQRSHAHASEYTRSAQNGTMRNWGGFHFVLGEKVIRGSGCHACSPRQDSAHAARPDLRPVATGDGGPVDVGLGADAVALPSELAHILRVPLPLAAHRQRQAAAGFAVEELIAEPLEASHVVLGPELGRGEYLVVVVAHREMAVWAARAAPGQRLVPDVLALPVPAAGCCSVREPAAGCWCDARMVPETPPGPTASRRFWRAATARRRSCSMADGCPSRCRSAPRA